MIFNFLINVFLNIEKELYFDLRVMTSDKFLLRLTEIRHRWQMIIMTNTFFITIKIISYIIIHSTRSIVCMNRLFEFCSIDLFAELISFIWCRNIFGCSCRLFILLLIYNEFLVITFDFLSKLTFVYLLNLLTWPID